MHGICREGIPSDFIIRSDYPEPTWADPLTVARYNPQLSKILLPLPFPPEEEHGYVDYLPPKDISPPPRQPTNDSKVCDTSFFF